MKDIPIRVAIWILVIGTCATIGAFLFIFCSTLIEYAAQKECFENKTPVACEWVAK